VSRISEAWLQLPLLATVWPDILRNVEAIVRPPETRFVTCPFCGAKQYAVITRYERPKDNDWDDGACFQCATPIISERCGSIFVVPKTSLQTQSGRPPGSKRMMRLRRLVHLQHIHPLAPDRRKALIDEARAARAIHSQERESATSHHGR
jgi:hypothetical protein